MPRFSWFCLIVLLAVLTNGCGTQTGPKDGVKDMADGGAQAQPRDSSRDITNSLGMRFVWIPPGSFRMGDLANDTIRDDETPHKVTLTKGFYMGMYAVTQEQWTEI